MKLIAFLLLFASAPLFFGQTFVTGQAARVELGQATFSRGQTTASQTVLGGVGGLAWSNGTLFVADDNRVATAFNNNRVMMFSTGQIPAPSDDLSIKPPANALCGLCGYPAFNVIGQTTFDAPVPAAGTAQGPPLPGRSQIAMSGPTAVATDGTTLAIADTNNNRVLLYNSVPAGPGAPASIVLGQPDFTTIQPAGVSATSLRGPQGVWINGGKLFVADTQNNRVLIWNRIPTVNNQPADLVLGQPNLNSANQPPAFNATTQTAANQLLSPTSVTTDPSGAHLFVSDLGFNRVLIWNSIPTVNTQPADLVVGQPDFTSTLANNTNNLCVSPGNDASGKPIFPSECNKTLNFPRYALSDGTRLFIADGGNDRVLVFNAIPTVNAAGADAVLGQPDFFGNIVSSGTATFGSTAVNNTGSVDTVQNPTSLAWDGTNLYVSDPFDRRVLLFTPITAGDTTLAQKSVLNSASRILRQEGFVSLFLPNGATIAANDTATVTIAGTPYTYTAKANDTAAIITQGLLTAINSSNNNAGDPNVFVRAGSAANTIALTAKNANSGANSISLSATSSNTAGVSIAASGNYLTGGTSATLAPGTLIEIDGNSLADNTLNADPTASLPTSLGGVQVYIDGFAAPLMMVSPNQVISQVPFNYTDRNSSSVYVRTQHANGQVSVTNAAPIVLVNANPGLFAQSGQEPRMAAGAMHTSGPASAAIDISGTIQAGDIATITIAGKPYTYSVLATDTLRGVAQNLVNTINANAGDPNVNASLGGAFARIILTSKIAGPAGANNASIAGSSTPATGKTTAGLIVTAYNSTTCCVNAGSGPVTPSNPALPGETITFLATGLGVLVDGNGALITSALAGQPYSGPTPNIVIDPVSAFVNNVTGQIIDASLPTGSIGVYQVKIQMPASLGTNPNTQVNIAQDAFVSNIVTIPSSSTQGPLFASPNPVPAGTPTTTVYWYVPSISTNVQLHIGAPTGPLAGAGGESGAATINNVIDGELIYLTDVPTGNVLGTTTLQLQQPSPTGANLIANPNPIFIPQGATYGRTTISWSVPADSAGQTLRVGSPTGTVLGMAVGAPGFATTGNWVTDGMTFYLTDTATGSVIGQPLVVHVRNVAGTITATPNPAPLVPGTPYGQTTITWSAPSSSATEIRIGGPGGTLFAAGTNGGTAATGAWVTDGLTFYLQDATNGNSTSPANTLGTLTLQLGSAAATTSAASVGGASLLLNPNPIPATAGSPYGQSTISWNAPGVAKVEVHVNSAAGPLFAAGGTTGSAMSGNWVVDGMTFYLVDASTKSVLASAVAQVR